MSTPNRSSKSRQGRTGSQYSLGGVLLTLLLLLLYWGLTGSAPDSEPVSSGAAVNPAAAVTRSTAVASAPETTTAAVVAANAALTQTDVVATTVVTKTAAQTAPAVATTASPSTAVPPTVTIEPTVTATIPPSPTSISRAGPPGMPVIALEELPPEALETLMLIEEGGPFPFARDGITFQNRERLLPQKSRGYYREYTVITPGESDRGARRIVAGDNGERYYTDDHYASFFWIISE